MSIFVVSEAFSLLYRIKIITVLINGWHGVIDFNVGFILMVYSGQELRNDKWHVHKI